MRKNILILTAITVISIIIGIVISIISSSQDTLDNHNNNTGKFIYGNATVDDIKIIILESFPVQVNVNVKGYLPDSCTKIDRVTKEKDGNTFLIRITTIRPADAICTQVIVPFQEVITLDVYGLKAGIYTVNVNGVKGTFELGIDNILLDYQNNSRSG